MVRLTLFQLGLLAVCLVVSPADAAVIHTAIYNGHTYHLLDTDGTKWWHEAELEAISLGGHLVTINDAAENQFVYETFGPLAIAYAAANNLPDQQFIALWLGYSDYATEGSWVWSSGETPSYTNWNGGEPAGSYTDEDFAGMVITDYIGFTLGKWHDLVGGPDPYIDLPFGVVEVPNAAAVPEPASLTLFLGLGAAGIAAVLSRRRVARK